MGTLQSNRHPASRIEAGDHVLAAAESLGPKVKPIKERLAIFATIHGAYSKADAGVKKADAAVRAQQTRIAEADVVQDEGVDELAAALVGEGQPRLAPFADFVQHAPAQLKRLSYEEEASAAMRLAAAVHKRRPPLVKSRKAASRLSSAAGRVLAEISPLDKLLASRVVAISKRDALELDWETSFASVKRAARAAEDDGARGLFDALFTTGPAVKRAAARKTAAKKKSAKKPVPA